jgi:DNA-3-methyladenine glycosylase
MFDEGGLIYVYLIYGMYWLLNIVTGEKDDASAVLIRGLEKIDGPGRVGKIVQIDKTFYGENITSSKRIWIESSSFKPNYQNLPRVGIDYSGQPWISKPWRFKVKN